MSSRSARILLAATGALLATAACTHPSAEASSSDDQRAAATAGTTADAAATAAAASAAVAAATHGPALSDAPLNGNGVALLDLAFRAASAIPVDPHAKTRAKAQSDVVAACLELDLPARALRYVEQMGTWRRGACYAELAAYCARADLDDEARRCIELALEVAESSADAELQEWRRHRIHALVAKAYVWLGESDRADEIESGIAEAETGGVDQVRATLAGDGEFDERLAELETVLASGDFGRVRTALDGCIELLGRFYADADRRARVEQAIRSGMTQLPATVQVELLASLAECAVERGDPAAGLGYLTETEPLVEGMQCTPDIRAKLQSRLTRLWCRAGKQDDARRRADDALAKYELERESIVNIDRADVLRAIAETYLAIGDTAPAMWNYERAVEAGIENPNSRPRAEDLAATCCSMALSAAEPDAELLARLEQLLAGLGSPW